MRSEGWPPAPFVVSMPVMVSPVMPDADPTAPDARPPRSGFNRAVVWLACGLGAGFVPFSPGTVGAIWGVPLAWGLGQLHPGWQGAIVLALFIAGIPICQRAAEALGKKDPGAVVFDEIVSMPLVFMGVNLRAASATTVIALLIAGYVLHRVFDITKPPPARQAERMQPAGLGIMADDVVAAIYGCAALHGLIWLGFFEFLL